MAYFWAPGAQLNSPPAAAGDLIVGRADGNFDRLAIGANGTFLNVSAGAIRWGNTIDTGGLTVSAGLISFATGVLAAGGTGETFTSTLTTTSGTSYGSHDIITLGAGSAAGQAYYGRRIDLAGSAFTGTSQAVGLEVVNVGESTGTGFDQANFAIRAISHGVSNASPSTYQVGAYMQARWGGTLSIGGRALAADTDGSTTMTNANVVGLLSGAQTNGTGLMAGVVAFIGSVNPTLPSGTANSAGLIVDNVGTALDIAQFRANGAMGLRVDKNASLVFSVAASKVIPGATSWTLRNNADGADNLKVVDAGMATLRQGMQLDGSTTSRQRQDRYTLANNTTGPLWSLNNTFLGLLMIIDTDTAAVAFFGIEGANNQTALLSQDLLSDFTTAAGSVGKTNIYWSVANTRYEIENKRGATRNYDVLIFTVT